MTRLRRSWLSLLLVAGLLLTVSAPVFAQDDTPDNPDGANLLFMPSAGNDAQLNADDDTSPAVTYLEVPSEEMVATARSNSQRTLPQSISGLKLDQAVSASPDDAQFTPALQNANAEIDAVIRLKGQSLAQAVAGKKLGAASVDQAAVVAQIQAQQSQVFADLQKYDANATVLANITKALNAVIVRSKLSALRELGANAEVESIRPVVNYQLDLSETVPYIGGKAVQDMGYDGAGVTVAVLDSGIDYTHVAFGGDGTAASYEAAYGTATTDPRNTTRDGLFPTAKVVEGYDFVGDAWPNGPLAPDDDPIDCGPTAIDCDGGHGTHVGDIIAGATGVAPGASLHAVRVCSAVSTSCSGIAMLQGLDYALDPNGDNDISDHVDIVNMSLGSPYGQENDDDSAYATDIVSAAGVLVVASAGNSADKPFIVGTPSGALSALSVAQTEVPSAKMPIITVVSPASDPLKRIGSTWQPFSAPVSQLIEAPVQFGAAGNTLGCDAFPADAFAGKIALVDRGVCAISIKVSNAALPAPWPPSSVLSPLVTQPSLAMVVVTPASRVSTFASPMPTCSRPTLTLA
ncbi:MAG: S8 family serine peptidase [Anaerolineales bacterium]|nr:S8 family serine peptidase [Anaerolineales bacterium]